MTAKATARKIKNKRKKRRRILRNRLILLTLLLIAIWGYRYKKEVFISIFNNGYSEKIEIVKSQKYLDEIPEEVKNSQDPVIQSLLKKAEGDSKVAEMLTNISAYPMELLDLAARKDEAIDFVYNYTKYDPSSAKSISINKDYKKGEIPLFIQWDERWGYEMYGSEFIAINGCGPTALSMVLVGLTGNKDMNPKAVVDFSLENGYLVEGVGSSWTLMTEGAKKLGLNSKQLPLNRDIIINTLKSGQPIIATMGPGTFTNSGHFIVLTGVDKDNKIIINDSDSKEKSAKTWDIEVIMDETENLWTFTAI